MISFSDLKKSSYTFLDQIFSSLDKINLKTKNWPIDHLCFRTKTWQEYISYKKSFEGFSKLLIESEINGRPISTFKLPEFLFYKDRYIDLIELPAPKEGKIYPTGFEHAEFVADIELSSIQTLHPNLTFDSSGLDKDLNPELCLPLAKGLNVKFHNFSLESIINIEKNKSVYSAIKSSQILKKFKKYNPLITGTFPLGIDINNSDLDFMMSCLDFNNLKNEVEQNYPNAKIEILTDNDESIFFSEFKFNDLRFEIFAQKKPSTEQRAYKHYLVEEQLLKLGGERLKQKIIKLKNAGLKTEPAFCNALNIKGDPYLKMLDLQLHTEDKLIKLL